MPAPASPLAVGVSRGIWTRGSDARGGELLLQGWGRVARASCGRGPDENEAMGRPYGKAPHDVCLELSRGSLSLEPVAAGVVGCWAPALSAEGAGSGGAVVSAHCPTNPTIRVGFPFSTNISDEYEPIMDLSKIMAFSEIMGFFEIDPSHKGTPDRAQNTQQQQQQEEEEEAPVTRGVEPPRAQHRRV
ncbi:unnamed protein product [Lampetra fluviatilis]